MKKIILISGILFLAASYAVTAEEIQVLGALDKRQAQVDEEILLNIKITGARGNLQAPRLPALQGFESFYTGRTSHFTFVNGQSTSTVEFSYILVPKVTGRFSLDPVQVWVDGKNYATQPFQVEVLGSSVQAGSPQPKLPPSSGVPTRAQPAASQGLPSSAPELIQDDNVFVKVTVDKQTAFPNEQILLTYTLYTRYDTRYEGFEEEPSVSGFWIEDFPLDRDLGRETVSLNGKRYVKAEIRKIALFPTAPADYTIQPGVMKVSIREEPKTSGLFDEFFADSFFSGSNFFSRRSDRLIKPEPLTIKVRPFPEAGKPKSFNGAAGQFRLSADVDKKDVKQNEPVTLKMVLEGEGNVETLPAPVIPELTGFKIYNGDTSTQLLKSGNTLGGKKTVEIIFIPLEAGGQAVPTLEFSFFNPRKQTYEVLRTPTFSLNVTASDEPFRLPAELAEKEAYKKEIQREARDIRYIHEEIAADFPERLGQILFYGLAGLNLLGFLWVAGGLLRRRREKIFARDHGLKRRVLARSLAGRRMKVLKQLAQSKTGAEAERFLEEAEKVLSEYFSNKFNVSTYAFTREWLLEKLAEIWSTEDALVREIQEFYDAVRETRYGKGVLPAKERRQVVELIEKAIRRMEKML